MVKNNIKRILMLNYEFPPLGGGGGVASYKLAKGFTQLGYEVDVVTTWFNGLKKFEKKQKNRIIATTLALFILIILFFAGPAMAFDVTLTTSPTEPVVNSPVTITAEILKNTNEVYADEINISIDGGTAVPMTCTNPTISSLGGYSYGYLNLANTIRGCGYGYGYGYTVTPTATLNCTYTFTPSSVKDYTIEIFNGEYKISDTESITVKAAPVTPGGSSTTPTVTPTTTPITDPVTGIATETVYNQTVTQSYTPEQLQEVLREMTDDQGNALFTESEIAIMIANAEEYEFEIQVKTDKVTDAQGNVSYKTSITTTITNNTGKDQRNVKVVIEVPKEVSETASRITSGTIFTILKDDPILEFTVPLLRAGQTQNITYEVTDTTQPTLTGVNFNDPTIRFAEDVIPTDDDGIVCPTVWIPVCGVDGITYSNDCYANAAGVAIAYEGECVEETPITETEMDWTLIIIVIIILVIIGGIAYYKKDDIQKMLKK
jgi:hypothetical protein